MSTNAIAVKDVQGLTVFLIPVEQCSYGTLPPMGSESELLPEEMKLMKGRGLDAPIACEHQACPDCGKESVS